MAEQWATLLRGTNKVRGVIRRSGECDAAEYLRTLDRVALARFQRFFEAHRDGRPIKSPQHIRPLTTTPPKVYELKSGTARVYLVAVSGVWFVTHGRKKPKDNQVNREARKAIDIYEEQGPQ